MTTSSVEAKLEEIGKGLEGVTEGPWRVRGVSSHEDTHAFVIAPDGFVANATVLANADHIARLDPTTVLSILSYIDELKRERDAAVGQWQPIETAPKEPGKELLLSLGSGKVVTGRWGLGRYDRSRKAYNRTWVIGAHIEVAPTHWRPLPAPPEGGSDGA